MSPAALTTSMSDAPERLADKWTQACDMLLNPETCPICDEHPVFTALTLPWLKPRDSCELGLLALRR